MFDFGFKAIRKFPLYPNRDVWLIEFQDGDTIISVEYWGIYPNTLLKERKP